MFTCTVQLKQVLKAMFRLLCGSVCGSAPSAGSLLPFPLSPLEQPSPPSLLACLVVAPQKGKEGERRRRLMLPVTSVPCLLMTQDQREWPGPELCFPCGFVLSLPYFFSFLDGSRSVMPGAFSTGFSLVWCRGKKGGFGDRNTGSN